MCPMRDVVGPTHRFRASPPGALAGCRQSNDPGPQDLGGVIDSVATLSALDDPVCRQSFVANLIRRRSC